MSLKVKLTSLITTFVLLCSLLTVGVFAVKNTTFNVGGDIVFNVQGIEADIELTTNGVQNAEFNNDEVIGQDVLSKIQIRNNTSADSIASQFAKWSNLDLTFAEGQSTATIELKISNVATEEDNYIDITALADATTKENARIKVANNDGGITALLKSGENATFTITFEVKDDEYKASLNDFSVNFDMQKKVLADFPTAESLSSAISFSGYDDTAMTVVVGGVGGTDVESLDIPAYVNKGDKIYKVTGFLQNGPQSGFYGTNIKHITLPNTITTIDESIGLKYVETLESIVIPASVTVINSYVFGSGGLDNVTISDYNSVYEDRDSNIIVEKETKKIIFGSNEAVIPNDIAIIGDGAFEGRTFTNIHIPNSVTSIGDYAFAYCGSLTSITISDSVTSIGDNAFQNSGLTSITIPDSVTSIGNQVFYFCTSLTSVTIPDSVTSIGGWAFYCCENLTSITIGNGVTSIGSDAFSSCENLTSITIPDSVTSIGEWAFYCCSNLTSITIPDSVTSIGNQVFYFCESLTSITIPNSVTSIGDNAFYCCKSLTDVYYRGTESQWNALLANIGIGNTELTGATIHYEYTGE